MEDEALRRPIGSGEPQWGAVVVSTISSLRHPLPVYNRYLGASGEITFLSYLIRLNIDFWNLELGFIDLVSDLESFYIHITLRQAREFE